MDKPKAIVAIGYRHFLQICKFQDWDRRKIQYIHVDDAHIRLRGYWREEVYPSWYAFNCPPKSSEQ